MRKQIVAAWAVIQPKIVEALSTNARLRRLFRENQRLIAWQRGERDKLRAQHNEMRARAFTLLSSAMASCSPDLQKEIAAFLPELMPQVLVRPRTEPPEEWIKPAGFDSGAKGTTVVAIDLKDPVRA